MGYARHSQILKHNLLIHLLKGIETPVGQDNDTKRACLRTQLSGMFCGVFTNSQRGCFQSLELMTENGYLRFAVPW